MCGDEHHRFALVADDLVDGLNPCSAVGELDVGDDKLRFSLRRKRHGLAAGTDHAHDFVAKVFHDRLEVMAMIGSSSMIITVEATRHNHQREEKGSPG